MQEATGPNKWLVRHGDESDRRTDNGTHQSQFSVALASKPLQATAHVENGLPVGFERVADIGPDEVVGPLVARNHSPVVIGHGKTQRGDSPAVEPLTNLQLYVPFGIPLRQDDNSRPGVARREKTRVHAIIFRPERSYRAGESEDAISVRAILENI